MTFPPRNLGAAGHAKQPPGFTLIELLASMAILAVLIMVLVSMVSHTSSVWRYTNAKIEQFREAREGYEALTRRLSQATLNTYWDYDSPSAPTKYIRQSELRFISGPGLAGDESSIPPRPTHSTFFFAPLGFVEDGKTAASASPYEGLDYLLNTWGYFVEYNSDKDLKPAFVKTANRNRFRLVEFMQPSQSLEIFKLELPSRTSTPATVYTGREWFLNGLQATPPPTHILAENIVALVLLPKASKSDLQKWSASGGKKYDDTSLVGKSYLYDSSGKGMTTLSDAKLNPTNQLPPIVQVSMVAIDEASAIRMTDSDNAQLLQKLGSLFKDPTKLNSDLIGDPSDSVESLAEYLVSKRINYRVFTSDVAIRGAKWSTATTN